MKIIFTITVMLISMSYFSVGLNAMGRPPEDERLIEYTPRGTDCVCFCANGNSIDHFVPDNRLCAGDDLGRGIFGPNCGVRSNQSVCAGVDADSACAGDGGGISDGDGGFVECVYEAGL